MRKIMRSYSGFSSDHKIMRSLRLHRGQRQDIRNSKTYGTGRRNCAAKEETRNPMRTYFLCLDYIISWDSCRACSPTPHPHTNTNTAGSAPLTTLLKPNTTAIFNTLFLSCCISPCNTSHNLTYCTQHIRVDKKWNFKTMVLWCLQGRHPMEAQLGSQFLHWTLNYVGTAREHSGRWSKGWNCHPHRRPASISCLQPGQDAAQGGTICFSLSVSNY